MKNKIMVLSILTFFLTLSLVSASTLTVTINETIIPSPGLNNTIILPIPNITLIINKTIPNYDINITTNFSMNKTYYLNITYKNQTQEANFTITPPSSGGSGGGSSVPPSNSSSGGGSIPAEKQPACILGLRTKTNYCWIDGKYRQQKGDNEECLNNFECKSNSCFKNKCYDTEGELSNIKKILNKIISFLKLRFRFG
jgi:hypothetical protein